jgi:hypothetical protein
MTLWWPWCAYRQNSFLPFCVWDDASVSHSLQVLRTNGAQKFIWKVRLTPKYRIPGIYIKATSANFLFLSFQRQCCWRGLMIHERLIYKTRRRCVGNPNNTCGEASVQCIIASTSSFSESSALWTWTRTRKNAWKIKLSQIREIEQKIQKLHEKREFLHEEKNVLTEDL